MTLNDLLEHFGTQSNIAKSLNLGRGTVWQWFKRNRIPLGRQYEIELKTGGALRVEQ